MAVFKWESTSKIKNLKKMKAADLIVMAYCLKN